MTDMTINQTLQYDEAAAFGVADTDDGLTPDNNVSSATFYADLTTAISSLKVGGVALTSSDYYTAPTSFPQYAQMTDFVSNPPAGLTSYFLASDSTGDAFSESTGVATTLYVGANEIFLYATDNSNVLVGRIGSGTTADPGGAIALVIALGGTAADPEIGVKVYAPIKDPVTGSVDDADSLNLSNLIYLGANFNTVVSHNFDTFHDVPSGSDAFAMILSDNPGDTLQLLVTGFTGSTEEPITISQAATGGSVGGGGGGQHVGPGNSLRIDTITGGDFSKADTSSEDNNTSNISFTGHDPVDEGSFKLVQINPGTSGTTTSLSIFAYDATTDHDGTQFVTDALASEGSHVKIDVANVHVFDANGNPATGVTITADGDGVKISGLQLNYTIDFKTPGTTFDRFVITNDQPTKGSGSNVTFDVGHIHVFSETNVPGSTSTEIGSHLVFEDGGPSVTTQADALATITVDESNIGTPSAKVSADYSGLFNINYGPDGAASSSPLGYTLGIKSVGVDSGLKDTATGHEIFLYMDGNDVVGRVGSSTTVANPTGAVDFRISVDTTSGSATFGQVTFEQDGAVMHGGTTVSDEPATLASSDLVTLTATVHDGDGDSASTTPPANIGTTFTILDDEPAPLAPNPGNNLIVGNTTSGGPAEPYSYTASDLFTTYNAGNDGVGSFTIVGPPDGTGDYTWAYGSGGTDLSTIIESYKGSQLFSLHLDSSTGGYTMTMLGTLPYSSLNLDANNIKAGGPTGSIDVGTINDGGDFVQISGLTNTTFNAGLGTLTGTTGAVNASNGNVGVNNGNLDSGEVLEFQLFAPGGGTPIGFYGLDMGTKTASSSSYELYGLFHSDGKIHDLGSANSPLLKGGVIHYAGTDLLDAIYVKETSGNAVKIGLAGVHLLLPPADAAFHYTAQLTDGDGDSVTAGFNVFIDGNNDGSVDTIHPNFV